MAIPSVQGTYTGLMGYERVFEHFGDTTLPYRALETYTYEVIDASFSNEDDLDAFFSTRFSALLGVFSGDINVTSLDFPNSQGLKEDLIRFQKHKLSVEVRTIVDFDVTSGYGDTKNSGLSDILSYYDILEDLTDDFSFNLSENGDKSYSHNVGFKLRTGSGAAFSTGAGSTGADGSLNADIGLKYLAKSIAESLLDNEPTDLSTFAFGSYGDFVSSGTTKTYYNETFDELKNTFSFSKTKSILPYGLDSYTHDMSHTITYTENGIFSVEEKIKVKGNNSYVEAREGLEEVLVGSQGRCEGIFSGYFDLAETHYSDGTISNNSSLVRTKTSKTFNVPNLTAEGSFSYTNDESKLGAFSKEETFNVSREQNGIISLDHEVQYSLYSHLDTENFDTQTVRDPENILEVMSSDREASFASSRAVVNSVIGLAGISTGITRTKTSIKSQDRKKAYSMQLSYSNSPVYDMSEFIDPFTSSAITTEFNMMSVDFSDEKPADIINEYTIINRPAQTNVLSYGYQQEPARVTISFKGNIPREGDNFTTPLSHPKLGTRKLLHYGKKLFLERTLTDSDIYNYYLADIKYNFNSSNDFGMTLEFAYTKKKYGNIS